MLLRVSWDLAKAGFGSRNLTLWNMASKLGLLSLKLSTTAVSSNKVVDVAAQEGEFRVFIVAGEVSGDSIASRLMVSLKKLSPLPVRFAGVGGFLMSKEGLQTLFPMEEISVMGLWELLPHLNTFRKLKETTEAALLFRPHVVITVDSKGFSFRLLKQLKAKYLLEDTCPVHVHYVAPSFWAWKGGEARLQNLCKFVDHMLCIIPFEEEICRLNGLAATYVGHPLLEDALMLNLESAFMSNNLKVHKSGDVFRREHGIPPGATVITLLPGSRLQEVKRILPIFLRTIEIIRNSFSELSVIILVAPNNHVKDLVDKIIKSSSLPAILVPGASLDQKYEAFSASTAALCASGSAVIELQLARLPCIVAYQTHILTELVIHYRTKLKYISLPNILMNTSIIPEVLFRDCTPGNLATILSELILDKKIQEQQTSTAEKFLGLLCPPSKNVNMLRGNLSSGIIWCPSMIAASTILSIQKQKRD
ncbi:probable lipid-A-disaccharide synthase, mitochondrial isoform X2 [Zingiber officinale]|uniref:probable lipid-A-disaccharide synthase, mitochondrial isoform X2 n=1 Tax=Zingiber officinale TaxID=94328 RepID=UPI001C4C852B|nr:probable lipid-A-disaccharide synthase, mitochondrial isoform X2 [Zingiber officinale]